MGQDLMGVLPHQQFDGENWTSGRPTVRRHCGVRPHGPQLSRGERHAFPNHTLPNLFISTAITLFRIGRLIVFRFTLLLANLIVINNFPEIAYGERNRETERECVSNKPQH